MTIRKCTGPLVESGQISQDQADRANGLFDELEADLSTKFGREAAAAMATEEALKRMKAETLQTKRQALLQVAAQQRIGMEAKTYKGHPSKAMAAFLAADDRAPYDNVEYRHLAIEGQAHAMMEGILSKFSRDPAGRVRNKALLENVVREAFGEDTGDLAAKELSEAWGQTAEMLRTRFNAAGGGIGKLEKWGLPQTHNMQAVRAASFEEWRNFIAPLLDREKMLDPVTGMRMTPQGLELSLKGIYEKIRSDGWSAREPGGTGGGRKLANRHAESRFLAFKDAESWMAYSRRFGRPQSGLANAIDPDGPIFDAMMGHISSMSRDIALAEVLGPNPAATVRWMADSMKRDEAVSQDRGMMGLHKAQSGVNLLDSLYKEISGTHHQPEYSRAARWFSAFRSYQAAAKLGSATLSATTDVGFQALTRRFNGIPATKVMLSYLKHLNPASAADRKLAVRMGLVAREASKRAVSQSRYVGEAVSGETAARLAEATMRASGLSAWTQAGQWAFGMDFLSHITHVSGQGFDTLAPPFRRTLERYGIGPQEWDIIRATPHEEFNGSQWFRPDNMEDQRLADRVRRMILTETDYAVPNVTLRTRALFNRIPKGTLFWEIIRAPLLFKTFSASVLMTHGARMMQQQAFNKLRYAAGLAVYTGVFGALAYQLKAIDRGQDPAPMDNPAFWGQALAQGGGLGIYGDFLNAASSRFDTDIYSTLAGPLASDVINVVHLAKSGYRAANPDPDKPPSHPGRDFTKILKADLPGSSLWYAKLAFQREMMDQMQRQIDPEYQDSFDRMEDYAKNNGQGYWWRPGQRAPERGPDMQNAVQSPPQ